MFVGFSWLDHLKEKEKSFSCLEEDWSWEEVQGWQKGPENLFCFSLLVSFFYSLYICNLFFSLIKEVMNIMLKTIVS